jgi:hypothetical protein
VCFANCADITRADKWKPATGSRLSFCCAHYVGSGTIYPARGRINLTAILRLRNVHSGDTLCGLSWKFVTGWIGS